MENDYCYGCMAHTENGDHSCGKCGYDPVSYVVAPHHLPPGTVLHDRYMVGKVLGEGGFGITYVGRDTLLDMKVAVKEFFMNGYVNRNNTVSHEVLASVGTGADLFAQNKVKFIEEARVLARFSNEVGIVGIRDFFEENGTAYMIMDFIEGTTLRTYLEKKGKMPMRDVITIMEPVMHALQHVHEQNVIHRDISPDNIMMTPERQIKLLDFGAAREISKSDAKSLSVILKPGYAPEEQYRSRGQQGTWTDVYALSATMYRCISGITPDDAMERMFDDKVKPLHQICACTPAVSSVIMKGLSVRKDGRYQSIRELRKDLERALDDPNFIVKAGTSSSAPAKQSGIPATAPKYVAPQQRVASRPGTAAQSSTAPQAQTGNRPVARQQVQTGQSAVPQKQAVAPQQKNQQTVPPAASQRVTAPQRPGTAAQRPNTAQQRPAAAPQPRTPQATAVPNTATGRPTAPQQGRVTAPVQQKAATPQNSVQIPKTGAAPVKTPVSATVQKPAAPVQKPAAQPAQQQKSGFKKWMIPVIAGGAAIALILIIVIVVVSSQMKKKNSSYQGIPEPSETQATQQYTSQDDHIEAAEMLYGISAGTVERWVEEGGFVMSNGEITIPLMQPVNEYQDLGFKPTEEYKDLVVPVKTEQMIMMEKDDEQGQWNMLCVVRNTYETDLRVDACSVVFAGEPIRIDYTGEEEVWFLYDGEQEIRTIADFEALHPEYSFVEENTDSNTKSYMYMVDSTASKAKFVTIGETEGGFNYITLMDYDADIDAG